MGVERYQRERVLAQGPMSDVWLARDTQNQKLVVLKMMKEISEDEKRNDKARERFLREIAIAKALRHPHILPLLDDGEIALNGHTVPYLVSPYIQSGSLADLVDKQPPWEIWSLLQTTDVITQAAESLYYLHTRSPHIVHQDVKPGNFLYRPEKSVERAAHIYLCDFGISRRQVRFQTMASELLGTFAYMAPEQAERKVDPASDQYALAVMACFLLTGRLPLWAATNEEYIQAHLYEEPRLPSELQPERFDEPDIDAVFQRALAKKPAMRFPTIIDFARALHEAVTEQVLAHARARTETLEADGGGTLFPTEVIPIIPDVAPIPLSPTVPAQPAEPALLPLTLEPLDSNDARGVLDEPLPARPGKTGALRMGNDEFVLTPFPLQPVMRYDLHARPRQLIWSHDGEHLASTLYSRAPLLLHRDGSQQEVHIRNAEQANSLSWSPNGEVVAVSTLGDIRFWERTNLREMALLLHFDVRAIDGLDWSIQGQLAVWIEHQIHLYTLPPDRLSAQRAATPQTLSTGMMRCGGPAVLRWSPNGKQLAAGGINGEVLCWPSAGSSQLWRVTAPGQKVSALAWSPDSAILIVAFRNNRIAAWNASTHEHIFTWEKLPAMPRTLSISTTHHIAIASSEQRLLVGRCSDPVPVNVAAGQLLVAWSPTQPELATLDEQQEKTVIVWRE